MSQPSLALPGSPQWQVGLPRHSGIGPHTYGFREDSDLYLISSFLARTPTLTRLH